MNVEKEKMSLLISTIVGRLREKEDGTSKAPIYSISPTELKELCNNAELSHDEAYFLALMATSIVRGMLQNPEQIPVIAGGAYGGSLGGSLIVTCSDMSINDND